MAPVPGAEARAEKARRPAEQRPQARGAGLRAQPHCGDSSPRPGLQPAAVAAAAAAAAATAVAAPGIAGPGPKRGVGSAGPRWGALSMRLRLGEGRGAALGASSPDRRPVTSVAGGPSGQPDPTEGVSFSRNENRPGFSGLVGKGSSSRRSGGWGRRRGEGREERKEGREDGRGREARVCAALSGCEACLRAVLRNDAPAVRAEERAGPGSPTFGLGLHRGRREEPWELGDGEARAVAETAAATAALRPSYWSPAPSSGFELGHAPSLGPVSPLTARSLRPSFCWPFSFSSHPSLVPQRQVSGPNFQNRPFRRISCLLPLSHHSLSQKPFHIFQS